MRSRRLLLWLFLYSLLSVLVEVAWAQDSPSPVTNKSAEDLHRDGLEALRGNDVANARSALRLSLDQDPNRPAALYNLGLLEFRDGNEGLAIGLWRKALALSPGFSSARAALTWAETSVPRARARETNAWETFRSQLLSYVTLTDVLAASLVLALCVGFLLLRYAGRRRRALLDESPMPPFPTVAALSAVLLLVSLALAGAKAYDLTVDRATLIANNIPARTTPDPQSAALFDLFEGSEVIVRQSQGDWRQVSVPGGLTGWVPKESLYVSSSRRIER